MKFIKRLLLSVVIAVAAGSGIGIIGDEFLNMSNEDEELIVISTGIIVFFICIYKFKVFKAMKELKESMSELIKKLKEYIDDSDNADLYAIAEEEYDREEMDKGLWSQALVKAKGDDNLRKVEYIKLRVRQLKKQA